MLKVALVGNPNSGKTTLFNTLTGSTAHVGNWPGVTVDKREGVYKKNGIEAQIVDLPGIYSLSPYTPEEVIARNFVVDETPDLVIDVVDSTNLERNLYLTTQLLEADTPVVVALNMMDVLRKKGDKIDVAQLEKALGVPVVEISALKEENVDDLMRRACERVKEKSKGFSVLETSSLAPVIEYAKTLVEKEGIVSPLFHAVKLVEGDLEEQKAHETLAKEIAEFMSVNADMGIFENDAEAFVADYRYRYVTERYSPCLKRANTQEETSSSKVDRVMTHKWFGIPLFLLILFAVFHVTFSENFLYLANIIPSFGEWCAKESDSLVKGIFFAEGLNSPGAILFYAMEVATTTVGEWISKALFNAGASEWAFGLVVDGVWGGISSVLSFVPQILVLFLCFSILEDSGYMARVAFILDKIFRRFGVSGRAFMPMIMGFGCSIPAMMNTRTLATEKERIATIRVIPFFSCGAKLPILTAIAGAIVTYFGVGNAEVITYGMYVIGMAVAMITLLVMKSTTKNGEITPFIMELPAYHMPRVKNLVLLLWDKLKHYIEKAFTIILVSCIVIWFLSNFGWNFAMVGEIDKSILASLGKVLQPLFTPLGFGSQLGVWGWTFVVAAVTGLIAKENVVATFASLAACIVAGFEGTEDGVAEVVKMIEVTGASVPALLSFIVFNLTTVPCFAAVASAKAELKKGTFRWTLLFWIVTSYISASAVYTIGSWWWTSFLWAGACATFVLFIVLKNKRNA